MTNEQSSIPRFSCVDSADVSWKPSRFARGVDVKMLGKANGRGMQLVRFAPGARFPDHFHTGPEFIYVLEGEAIQDGKLLRAGYAGVAEKGTIDAHFSSPTGCTFLLVYELGQVFDSTAVKEGEST